MSTTHIAIDVADKTDDDVLELISTARHALYNGKGARPLFAKWLDMSDADCLRAVLGAPSDWFTPERKKFFEVIYAHQFGLSLHPPLPELWKADVTWMPTNPRASSAPLSGSTIDLEFISHFDFTDRTWDADIFHSGSLLARVKRSHYLSDEDKLRAYLCLAMIGFSNPGAFFVAL